VADVYELDMARVKVGSPVAVKSVAYPDRKPFEGKIEWIAGVLDKETRTAKMRCSFDNADRALKPEMFVTVSLQVDQKRVLALPRNALMRLGDVTVVFIESGKAPDGRTKFERVPLAVDEGEGGKWIPLSGPGIPKRLAKGVRIVSAGGVLLSTSG
jgi:multidrug efflux pump subunit AcrA (membrane-fusion protein)